MSKSNTIMLIIKKCNNKYSNETPVYLLKSFTTIVIVVSYIIGIRYDVRRAAYVSIYSYVT